MKRPLLTELTLEEKIGQLLMGYQWDINRKSEVDPKIIRTWEEKKAVLEDFKFGSLWAQTGDGNRGTALNEELNREKDFSDEFGAWIQAESDCYEKIPALTCLDAEREGAGTVFGDLTATCPPPVMGATNDEELVYKMGAAIARELRCAGCNWRWTPVVDLCGRFTTSVLRSYAPHDPEKQARLALAHALGMQSEGVAATAKHFPGGGIVHGEGYRDAHFCPTQNAIPFEEWEKTQGKVFQTLIDGGVYSIMISHAAFLAVDDSRVNGRPRPSTISKKVITDLLKNKMGFKGVVVTDAIVMGALFQLLPYDELLIEVVNAGNDIILGTFPQAKEILINAVNSGKIEMSRIDDACSRILDMKEKLGMFEDGYRLVKGKAEDIVPYTKELNMEVARKGVTLMRDRNNIVPFDKNKVKNVTIICSTHADHFVEKLDVLKKEFEDRGAVVTIKRRLVNNEELAAINEKSDLIIYAVYVGPHEPMGPPSLYGEELKTYLYAFSSGKEKSIGVSFGYPYIHHDIMENADAFVNAYGWSPDVMKAFVEGVYGEIEFKGVFPMKEYGENDTVAML